MFETYLQNQLDNTPLYTTKTKSTQESYQGIIKSDYPKWEGWKVIRVEKQAGIHISNIDNKKLTTLVRNFYFIKYIEDKYED